MAIWHDFIHSGMRYFRRRRARDILGVLPDINSLSVLDVGGSRHYWNKMDGILRPASLVLLNIAEDGQSAGEGDARLVLYDGNTIPFPDKAFDVVFCNSVIEHVPLSNRQRLAREIERVGKSYFVQTPALAFPVEPHFVMPFIHWMPRPVARKLVRFGLHAILAKRNQAQLDDYFDEVRLLSLKELRGYFSSPQLMTERLFGVPKSYTVFSIRK